MRICISIISWMPMRKTQHEGRVLNSSANPLPAAFFGAEIPLSEVSPHRIQPTDKSHVLDAERARLEG